ncbi:TatD family hydrolase [Candidatus Uhrbacteria bacterium]|nr:TatD family hydrolase [Candidatus Uhrbacteria bacterium]
MKPFLVDTHCHLHFPAYDADREQVLERMNEKNIWALTIGTAIGNARNAIKLAESTEGIWATVGLHPSHTTSDHVDTDEGEVHEHDLTVEGLVALARSSKKVVAIGEAGLDFYRLPEEREAAIQKQEKVFRTHIEAAKQLDLPLVVHCRDALSRLAEILEETGYAKGVVHSFTGTWEEAKPLLDLGMHIAVNGIATFPLRKGKDPSTAINETIKRIPVERLLVETDAPWLAPNTYRGKRNEPSYVEEVAKHAAHVRGVTLEEIAKQTTENARALFLI